MADRPYPAHWEADVVLRDGGTAHLRPITPSDADGLREFHRGQSAESIYLRFFAPYPELSDRDVERFTHVDHVDRVALVALIGGVIVGVVRFDRVGRREAEVAFNISDAHQGRGLGSVLLEHIAAAARERGIERFVAEVLPSNRRMQNVFTEAGYAVTSAYDDGVVTLRFDLAPTETSRAVTRAREQRAEARSVQRLLRPSSVAVVGVSRAFASVGQTLLRNLTAAGFPGPVHAVNPSVQEVAGQPAYPSVVDVPGHVDLAVVAVPAEAVPQVVADCARKGVRGLLVVSAGYAESGPEGLARQAHLAEMARAHGMRLVGPHSFGMVNTHPDVRLNASLSPTLPARGTVGLFSQSGPLAIVTIDAVVRRGLGLSTFVAAGARADVSVNDMLQYWEDDPDTEVVLLHVESIGNPRKFSRLARRLARHKPVVAVRSGRSTQASPLDRGRRGSTLPPAAVDALFEQSGVIRVDSTRQLLDVGQLLGTQPLPRGDRVAVVSNSDPLALLTVDACEAWRLRVVGEPRTLHPDAPAAQVRQALEAALADPEVDSLVAVLVAPLASAEEDLSVVVAQAAQSCGFAAERTIVSTYLGLPRRDAAAPRAAVTGVPRYTSPEEAVAALAAATRYGAWRSRDRGELPELDRVDPASARALVGLLLAEHDHGPAEVGPEGVLLDLADTASLLARYGIDVVPSEQVGTAEEAVEAAERIGYPVALKTTVPRLRHRPDMSDVRLGIRGPDQLRAAHRGLARALGEQAATHLVVQRMAPPGVACVVGSVEDPLFGPVVSFGLGGLATELLGDRAYRVPPITDAEAADMVRSVAASPLLFGHLGADPADVRALEDVVLRVSRLADDLPEVVQLELNPVLVGTSGAAVLHARVRLSRSGARADEGPRRMSG